MSWGKFKSKILQDRVETASIMKLAGIRRGVVGLAIKNAKDAGLTLE